MKFGKVFNASVWGMSAPCSLGVFMGEEVRPGRYDNVSLGLGVAILPWNVAHDFTAVRVIDLVTGLVVAALAVPRAIKKEQYGLWDKFVF
ncbi:MAG: hypothetical protein ACR2KZ_09500 [Segetibacter sp.]